MLMRALPTRTTSVDGPVDTGRLNGMFVIRYAGEIGAQDMQDGNLVVAIGAVMGAVCHQFDGNTSTPANCDRRVLPYLENPVQPN